MNAFFQDGQKVSAASRTALLALAGIAMAAGLTAQTPAAAKDAAAKGDLYTATSDSVTGAKDSIRIELRRWSTDEERNQVLSAWTKAAAPAGRGPAPAPADEGRGRGRGGAPPPRLGPEAALAVALGNTPSLGTLWSSETTGYSIHYASKTTGPDGGDVITLVTDRRLGSSNTLWRPVGGQPSAYEFSVIELHVNAKGEGEGKASISGKVVVDGKNIALENYGALPVVLRNVKRAAL